MQEDKQELTDAQLSALFIKLCEDVAFLADRARKQDLLIRKAE